MKRQHYIAFLGWLTLLAQISSAYANDEGKELYDQYCSSCHGADKEGVQNYTGDFENFTARLNGVTENMSDFTDFFDDDEVVALYEYVVPSK
jgi:mono/diheme cytochrome c family protein